MCVFYFLTKEDKQVTSFLQDKQLTIAMTGEIDHHSAKEIMRDLGNKVDAYLPSLCVLDFRDVTFMDSSGIAIVIHTIRRMQEIGGTTRLQNIPPQPMKVLRAAGIEKIMQIEERSPAR